MNDVGNVKKYYDENAEAEWNRLDGFHFEFEITKRMLARYLTGKSVLDVGGGPGRYSVYLAQLGYDVTLVDLSSGNVRFAARKASERGVNITVREGDARDLSSLGLGEFDNVLLMGPLYHLFDEGDREKCLTEARKHLSANGVIFASFVATHGGFNYYLDACPLEIINEPRPDLFDCMQNNKSWIGNTWTDVCFTEQDEIEPLFDKCGFDKLTLFGQEGVTATRLSDLEAAPDDIRRYYLELSLRLCEMKKYFPYSSHLMYVGKKRGK